MSNVILRKTNRAIRKLRVRKKVLGTVQRPRLSIFRSNKYCYGQVIDDAKGKTLVSVTLTEVKEAHKSKTKIEAAKQVGVLIAQKSKEAKIKTVIFDRNGYRYHGRVKSLADGAREGGLTL